MVRRISGGLGTVPSGGSRESGTVPSGGSRGSGTVPFGDSPLQRRAARDEVAKVAYELFERRGRAPGHDLEDWLEAERIVAERRRTRGPR